MKRHLDDHQDIATGGFGPHQQGKGKEAAAVAENYRVATAALGHIARSTGAHSPCHTFSDSVKSEIMQSSVQYPVQSYQMTSGLSAGGSSQTSSPMGVHIHHGHGVQHATQGLQAASQQHAASIMSQVQPQPPQQQQQQQQQQQHQQFQRLKVEDALSYLDQVKFKFGNQPQVYNDFLDIMKEFKSQSIDTPGVIARVSHLFKGHPELIVGFNTFLPPGYKIEVQANEQVNVCVPGSTTATILHPAPPPSHSHHGSPLMIKSGHHVSPASATISQASPPSQHSYHHIHSPASPSPVVMTIPANQTPSVPQTSQPVEFNHAINYVNKIKNRFQGQPDIYKQFLEILHTYQKEQRNLKEGVTSGTKPLTEAEVYQQVAKLFQNQEDLLQEFGQFLPDANGAAASLGDVWTSLKTKKLPSKAINNDHTSALKKPPVGKPSSNNTSSSANNNQAKQVLPVKRPISTSAPMLPSKKLRPGSLKDVTLAEAGKFGTLNEFAFFDKVRKALRSQEVYDNFLRCLLLFNQEVVSRSELVQLVTPFLGKYPELFKWFKDFLGYKELGTLVELIPQRVASQERVAGDLAMEIDYTTCKRLGASYCALPKTYMQPKCSGRTALCREVLNDTWVSFPSWSEDSTFVSSRKTQYEEYIYRCEDERFELDVVLETNLATIRVLEGVQRKMSRMTSEETARYKLDDSLGGASQIVHQRTIRRIYGEKAMDIIDGLKRNPVVAVPLVLRRLKAKEEEWREAQKNFNRIWRDQNEKYYLKSLDHQGINFKQNDVKALRSKSLLNEIETLYDERHEQAEEGTGEVVGEPHMVFTYKDKSILDDASNLIIHHVKRQTGIHKDDKRKIKQLIRQFLPDLFFHPRQELSDDEKEDEDVDMDENSTGGTSAAIAGATTMVALSSGASIGESVGIANGDSRANATPSAEVKPFASDSEDAGLDSVERSKDETVVRHTVAETTSISRVSSSPPHPQQERMETEDDDNNARSLPNGDLSDTEKNQRNDSARNSEEAYTLFFVNNNWYLFFRLHQILCERLTKIYERAVLVAAEEAKERKDRKECTAVALRLKPRSEIEVEEYYPAFLDMIQNLLDGNMESNAYEDTLREMFGIHAFIAFTLDKVIQNVVRQLQHIVCDESCIQCTELFLEEQKNNSTGGPLATASQRLSAEATYQKQVEQLLSEENCFRVTIYKPECRLCIELLDTDLDASEDAGEVEKWSHYVEKYVSVAESISEELKDQLSKKPIFLPRNIRKWRQRAKKQHEQSTEDMSSRKSEDDVRQDGNSSIASCTDRKDSSEDMELMDDTQCKFNLNSFKMVFVVNSESYLYKRMALKKAKQCHKKISTKLNKKFIEWHRNWSQHNVDGDQQRVCTDWMMGCSEGQVANNTRLQCDNNLSRPPYHAFNRYRVEWVGKAS